jgi:hypothetical protein
MRRCCSVPAIHGGTIVITCLRCFNRTSKYQVSTFQAACAFIVVLQMLIPAFPIGIGVIDPPIPYRLRGDSPPPGPGTLIHAR